jgi:DNA polymerase V
VIQKILSIVGRRIVEELRGLSCINLQQIEQDRKQIISSRSFESYVTTLESLRESIASHVSEAAAKLRKQNLIARNLTVFIQTNPYSKAHTQQYFNSCSMQLLTGSSHTGKLIHYSFECLNKIFREGFYYKKAGIILNDLNKKTMSQLDFFSTHDSLAEDQAMQTLDKINRLHGRNTLKYAALGVDKEWDIKFKLKSPCYTTRWSEVLKV